MKEIGCIVKRFDLVVVATPGNNFAGLFARDAALSPYDRAQQHSLAGLFAGFRLSEMRGAVLSVLPGAKQNVKGWRARDQLAALRRAGHAARLVELARIVPVFARRC